MNSQASVPPTMKSVSNTKTHLGCNVQIKRFKNAMNTVIEEVTLSDTRELSKVAFSPGRIADIMARSVR